MTRLPEQSNKVWEGGLTIRDNVYLASFDISLNNTVIYKTAVILGL